MKFKKYLKSLEEVTVAADIATVDTKLDMTRRQAQHGQGKKCKKHKQVNCPICEAEIEESWK